MPSPDTAINLNSIIQHINIKSFDACAIIDQMERMSFQSRNLARATRIYEAMLVDPDCTIVLGLAGSLFSAGLKQVVIDMIEANMVDAIVSTGANIVDQDFFEALGFSHYKGDTSADDELLRANNIDRIYDTYIREDDLRVCDNKIQEIADSLPARAYSSREFIGVMGEYLANGGAKTNSVIEAAHRNQVPIFVPAFSDCSAGFGLVAHQHQRADNHVAIDSVKDFRELTQLKIDCGRTGIFLIGGGVPKNFIQDTVVAADLLGHEAEMHHYSIQITVADERDGALSGSTLKEAHSWGKVNQASEQMVFCEATIAMPLIVSGAYHRTLQLHRRARRLNTLLT